MKNKSFTIISGNCWGGGVYEDLNLPYTTPTVGLFFYAPCYIEFLKDIQYYINTDMSFVGESKYPEANKFRKDHYSYPIGVINNVEIHFLHYKNNEEALEKWNRRCKRINFSNLYIAITDRDNCTPDILKEFDVLPYKNKVAFVANNPVIQSAIWLRKFNGANFIGDIYSDRWAYRRYFNVVKWLNNKEVA